MISDQMQIKVEDLQGLSPQAKRSAIQTLLERKDLELTTREGLEDIFIEEVLKVDLGYAYTIKTNGSRNSKKRLVNLYLEAGKVLEAANLVQEEQLDELRPETFSRLEKYALQRATNPPKNARYSLFEQMGESDQVKKYLKMAKNCSDQEASLILAKVFEEAGHRDKALRHYREAESHEDIGRICLLKGEKWEAALSYSDAGKNLEFALGVFMEDKHYENACRVLGKLGRVEEIRKIAEEHGLRDILMKSTKSKNKWVRKGVYERYQKKRASTLKEKIAAHDSGVCGTGEFLEFSLSRKLISKKTKIAVAEYLAEEYSNRAYELRRDDRPGDGGPPIPAPEACIKEARRLTAKLPELWTLAERYDKLAEGEYDDEKKIALYLQGGHKNEAIIYLNHLQQRYASELELGKAREVEDRINGLGEKMRGGEER